MELVFEFLTGELKLDAKSAAETLWRVTSAAAATTNQFS